VAISVVGSILGTIVVTLALLVWRGVANGYGLRSGWRILRSFVISGGTYFYPDRRILIHDLGTVGQYLARAEREVDYIGFWLASSLENSDLLDRIRTSVAAGIRFRIAFMNPESPLVDYYARYFNVSESELSDRILRSVEKLQQLQSELAPRVRQDLQLLFHEYPLSASCFMIDPHTSRARLMVDHKFPHGARTFSYGLELAAQKGGLLEKLEKEYEEILRTAVPIPESPEASDID